MAPSSLTSSSLSSTSAPSAPSPADTRAVLATLLSTLLVVVWAALAVGVVLTVMFPERSVSATGSSTMSAR